VTSGYHSHHFATMWFCECEPFWDNFYSTAHAGGLSLTIYKASTTPVWVCMNSGVMGILVMYHTWEWCPRG